jgi:uncharacterized membrane protein YuzA (DUF378 family)
METNAALRRYKAAVQTKFQTANLLAYSVLVLVGLATIYQLIRLRDVGIETYHDHKLREEFLQLRDIERYHFVQEAVVESHRIVGSGVWTTAFRRWWEGSTLFGLFSLSTWLSQIIFGVLVVGCGLVAVYMFMLGKRDDKAIQAGLELHKEELKLKMERKQRKEVRLSDITMEKPLALPLAPPPPTLALVEAK